MRWLGAAPCTSLAPLGPCTSLWVPRASLRLRRAALGCFSFHTRPTVRGCQGATRFDCQKLEEKKIKSSGGVSLQTGGFLGRMEGTAVFGGARWTQRCIQSTKVNFVFENGYTGTIQENQRLHRSRIIIVFIVSSQKTYCIAQFKISFSSAEKTAHA